MLFSAQPAVAAETAPSPWGLYFQGKADTARQQLERQLAGEDLDPATRRSATATLLEICIHSRASDCILEQVPKYVALPAPATPNELLRREDVRRTGYFLDYGKFTYGAAPVTAKILDGALWRQENAANPSLYLRRQILASSIQLALEDYVGAGATVDKTLSLIASLKNPQEDPFLVAWALSDAIDSLRVLGQSDRAYGVYRASSGFIAASLPPLSVDALMYRLIEAELLLEQGQFAAALPGLDLAVATANAIELSDDSRAYVTAQALTRKAVACTGLLKPDCARQAIEEHPYGKLYRRPGRTPAGFKETAYLAARALVAAIEQRPDPVAAKALSQAAAYEAGAGADAKTAAIYRTAGRALALPPGAERQAGLAETGRLIAAAAKRAPATGVGASRRPAAIEQILISFALRQADQGGTEADETNFTLFQLAARIQATVDADALVALSQAKDALQRRSIHQGLRLRARRDAYERSELAQLAARPRVPANQVPLSHDIATRGVLRDFAVRLNEIDRSLPSATGSNVVELKRFQATLRPGEAALSVAMIPGGMAYMCVRQDSVTRLVAPADLKQATLDIKILQAALTAGHAPSDALDAQFPAAAAVRMHQLLIAPFGECVKEGDHLLWLANASVTPLPLSILLPQAPPKLGEGYDLAQADWLVRRHAVSYAGSPSAILAARSGALAAASDFDFLGVGDPVLSGATATGEDRGKMLLRGAGGAGLAALAPLPETKDELERSAKGFATTKLLFQNAATERGVRGQLLGSYRYLSFATHGLIRDEIEGLSEPALALTPVSSADPLDDGLLTASEIADLNLGARFVALSACNTANYDVTQMAGELPALASAFAVAGVPSTLGSLWAVDSETTKEVVATTFATLRTEHGESPALALAQAQRSFLATPPSRAYLHPRFWAPMIVLGDGARPPQAAPSAGVVTVEAASAPGEVTALKRSGDRVVTRFSDAGAQPVSGVAMSRQWRRETSMSAPTRLLIEQQSSVIVGGGQSGVDGRTVPVLETLDKASGAVRATWRGEAAPGMDSLAAIGVAVGPSQALVAIADSAARERAGGREVADRLRVMLVEGAQAPRLLFTATPPQAVAIEDATLALLGDHLLVTYTVRHPAPPRRPLAEDDYELAPCMGVPITWAELRDRRTGALIRSQQLTGWTAPTAMAQDGRVLLGGGLMAACESELKAGVIALDEGLQSQLIYRDDSLGWSEVRAMGARPDGGALIAAAKVAQVDLRLGFGGQADPYAPSAMRRHIGALLLTLRADGSAAEQKLLDSGSDLYLSGVDASRPGEALLGGSLGGQAVVFKLTAERR